MRNTVTRITTRLLPVLALLAAGALALGQENGDRVLRVGVNGLPQGLDPAANISIGQHGFRTLHSVFDPLIARDFENNAIVPGLAESWEWISDTELELNLRPGVTFHNGEALTAADVVFTFERILDPASPYVTARGYFGSVAAVEASDEATVLITTSVPDPVLEHYLTLQPAYIIPAAYFQEVGADAFNQLPIGTGPYRVVELVADSRLVLERFGSYWGGPAPAAGIVFQSIPEVSARITALVNGEVDIVTAIPPDQVEVLDRFEGVEAVGAVLSNIHLLRYNTANPVLGDVRLRQALNLAIDRQLLSDALWGGGAVVPLSHQFWEYGDMYMEDWPLPAYDPERAAELVAESGYAGEPVYFNAHPTYYVNGLQAAEAIVEMWRAVGVNAEVRVAGDPAGLFGLASDDPFAMINSWSNSMRFADPAGGLWTLWGGEASGPQGSGYWTPEGPFNELGRQALATRDAAERYRIYGELLAIWEQEAPGTVLYRPLESYGVRSGISWAPYTDFHMEFRAGHLSFE